MADNKHPFDKIDDFMIELKELATKYPDSYFQTLSIFLQFSVHWDNDLKCVVPRENSIHLDLIEDCRILFLLHFGDQHCR
jgi:hypothetical protein